MSRPRHHLRGLRRAPRPSPRVRLPGAPRQERGERAAARVALPGLAEVLDCLPCAILLADRDGRVLARNRPATLLFETGDQRIRAAHPALAPALSEVLDEVLAGGFARPREVAFDMGAGPTPLGITGTLILDESGAPIAVLVVQDASAQVELARRGTRDSRGSAAVTETAHELRAPISSVLGYLEIAESRCQCGARGLLEQVHRSAERLTTIVSDILEQSRCEQRSVDLRREQLDVAGLVEGVLEAAGAALPAGLRLEGAIEAGLPPLPCDPERIERVLSNLVENALKYSPEGGLVTVSARKVDRLLELAVEDQGVGIAPADLPRLFERGFRARSTRTAPGDGLGLSIVKAIVEAHGGSVSVASAPGKGSRFAVRLPLQ